MTEEPQAQPGTTTYLLCTEDGCRTWFCRVLSSARPVRSMGCDTPYRSLQHHCATLNTCSYVEKKKKEKSPWLFWNDRDSGTSHYLSWRTLLPGRGLLNLLNLKEDWAHAYGVRSLESVRVLEQARSVGQSISSCLKLRKMSSTRTE